MARNYSRVSSLDDSLADVDFGDFFFINRGNYAERTSELNRHPNAEILVPRINRNTR